MSQTKPFSPEQVASAIADVMRLDFDARLNFADRIFEDQPAALGAVVQLHSLGVDFPTQEHAFHILFVLYECFTRYVRGLPRITEEMVSLRNRPSRDTTSESVPLIEDGLVKNPVVGHV